jgi:Fe-S oxidoreductase
MKKFNIYPKHYTRQINNNENVIMGTRYANKMINSCTLCGLCNEQCHLDISMKDIIQETRESMVERGKMPPSAHDFALKDMEFSNSSRFFLVKSPPPIPEEKRNERERELFTYPRLSFSKYAQSVYKKDEPGTEQVDFLFYPGCQLSASSPEYVEKAYKYLLSHIKEGVGLMLGCCGAPADWAGRQDLMKENVERFRSVWVEKGKPTFILACSSCKSIFEKYLPDIPVVSLWEIFLRYGIPENSVIKHGQALNVHDACSTRHNQKIHESIRKIASSIGCEIKELKYSREMTKCCGYGGLVYYANRDQAKDFVTDRINESSEDMLVYCAMCKDLFVDGGKSTYHILDLIFGEDMDSISHKKMPTLSERHQNRAALKIKLLKDLWGEESGMDAFMSSDFTFIIPEDVQQKMEDRYILMEDIQKVIEYAEKNKERFFNAEDQSYLANQRIANVTYWVSYQPKDDKILVKSVYSHRMEIVEE